jgi:predicted Zn-dependent protease
MVAEMDGTLTGMTRDGVFAIENGKLAGPLRNMRWHDNPFRMLGAVTGMSDARILFGRARLAGHARAGLSCLPALRMDGFHISSVTKF